MARRGTIETTPENHLHHMGAFSQTGSYSLQFEITGMYAGSDGDPGATTATATYGFSVVPEPSTAGLLLGAAALTLTVLRRRVS